CTSAHLYGHSIPTRSCPPLVASSDRRACLSYLLLWRFSQSPQAPHSWRARSSVHLSSWEPRSSSPLSRTAYPPFDQQQWLVPRLLKPILSIPLWRQRVSFSVLLFGLFIRTSLSSFIAVKNILKDVSLSQ